MYCRCIRLWRLNRDFSRASLARCISHVSTGLFPAAVIVAPGDARLGTSSDLLLSTRGHSVKHVLAFVNAVHVFLTDVQWQS